MLGAAYSAASTVQVGLLSIPPVRHRGGWESVQERPALGDVHAVVEASEGRLPRFEPDSAIAAAEAAVLAEQSATNCEAKPQHERSLANGEPKPQKEDQKTGPDD